jgi:nitroreductase
MMEFDTVIKKRASVRSFKSKVAPWDKVLDAIDAANQGPFAGNHNNLKFLIIEDQEKINKIAELSDQLWINDSGLLVLVCSEEKELENKYEERGRIYSRQQAGAAIVTFLLKIVDLGLSACWIGAYDDEKIKHLLQIPKGTNIEAIIPVGYEKEKTPKKKKRNLETTIYWETWFNSKRPDLFTEKKDVLALK